MFMRHSSKSLNSTRSINHYIKFITLPFHFLLVPRLVTWKTAQIFHLKTVSLQTFHSFEHPARCILDIDLNLQYQRV